MSAISELIRSEADGTISFGDYTLDAKAKLDNFGHQGDLSKTSQSWSVMVCLFMNPYREQRHII